MAAVPSGNATAVAVVSSPGVIGAGGVFPVAVDQCVLNLYWNPLTNRPLIDPLTSLPYEVLLTNGQVIWGVLFCGHLDVFPEKC